MLCDTFGALFYTLFHFKSREGEGGYVIKIHRISFKSAAAVDESY